MTLALCAATIGLLACRVNLLVVLLLLAGAIHLLFGAGQLVYIAEDIWVTLEKEAIVSIPVFVLCGAVMAKGAIADQLIAFLREISKPIPGGLGVASILACAVFASVSGSSMVTLFAMGGLLYPALLKQKYSRDYALGAVTSAGTLGILIPPSIPLIIYGVVTETSIADLFWAGVIPGALLIGLWCAYSCVVNAHQKRLPMDIKQVRRRFARASWALSMPVVLLGGIYSGIFTPAESAAVALVYALCIEIAIYRQLTWGQFAEAVRETLCLLGSFMPIIALAGSLNMLLIEEQIPQAMTAWLLTTLSEPW